MASEPKPNANEHHSVPSHVGEHGVWGYDTGAVGGFGEGFDAQAARGSEPDLRDATPEDAELARAVQKYLGRAHVDAADLRVDVTAGKVTLYGSVRDELEKSQLEARAAAVPGVSSVSNRLGVSHALARP